MALSHTDTIVLARPNQRGSATTMSDSVSRIAQQFLNRPAGLVGLLIVVLYFAMALVGESVAPFPYSEQHLNDTLQSPSAQYLFGTDQFGRDVFSRVLVGSRSILILATSATTLALLVGTVIGLTAGYSGGLWDEILMRLSDVLLSFPALLLALLIVGTLGSDMIYLTLTIGVIFAPAIARVVRSVVLDIKTKDYIEAARSIGASVWRVALRHILPNISGTIVVEASINFSYAILVGAGLGFLGLGVQPPSPDWGLQVNEGRAFILTAPWIIVFPALAISSLTVGVNLMADAIAYTAKH